MKCRFTLVLLLCWGFATAALDAQIAGGNVSGVVTDSSGASVPQAKVVLRNAATQSVRTLSSNLEALRIGSVDQTIEIEGPAAGIGLSTSVLGAVVNQKTIVELPLNGRSWTDLAALEPGVVPQTPYAAGNGRGNRGFGVQLESPARGRSRTTTQQPDQARHTPISWRRGILQFLQCPVWFRVNTEKVVRKNSE
jgi:hypothetical protein